MNKSKLYIVVIIALLISNAILIGFMVFPKHKSNRGDKSHKIKNRIIKQLEFDDNQIVAFEKLIEKHREEINKTDEEIIKTKRLLFKQLQTNNQETSDSLLLQIATYQQQAERNKYNHLKAIKNLCKPSQRANFDTLISEIGDIFRRKRRRNK